MAVAPAAQVAPSRFTRSIILGRSVSSDKVGGVGSGETTDPMVTTNLDTPEAYASVQPAR